METRKITVILESGNGNRVIETGAETLGELKRDLAANGIEYEGKVIREGLSRTELIDDNSLLPKDVLFRGQTTNNLVFTLTTANKKIRSGAMTRKEAYEAVKKAGLEGAVKAEFGKNFTQVATDDLITFFAKNTLKAAVEAPRSEQAVVPAQAPVVEGVSKEAFNRLVEMLEWNCTLGEDEADELRGLLCKGVSPVDPVGDDLAPWSASDLAEITRGM